MEHRKSYEQRVLEAIERAHWLDNFPILPDKDLDANRSGKEGKGARVQRHSHPPGAEEENSL